MVKVFDIGKEMGGLKPVQRGGGFQSKSLRLEDANGKQYVLRSIEEYPDKVLPDEFRQTFVKDVIVDGISASYPYAALSVPPLAVAADVPHANPSYAIFRMTRGWTISLILPIAFAFEEESPAISIKLTVL
jgi:hypothetical protein